ncbi:NYN domain-containing protein [Endozoicomonas gorgoniicola]|uniref:NYN domain-containing protein n=1 Tax=Endozoicomonas gorgoniicola TaxID=1234144 RepID=A0ABT3N0A8_9GAMM|nr:NYN domain-containing protein [Endozoicomonas gorgoniicola]MCW7555070.1 NYN domain-containing protein [Endozoicomonas gorgoniicola]
MSRRTVAIFVDAGFFNRLFTKLVDPEMTMDPAELAKKMWHYWIQHVDRRNEDLYRIYYYDCPPLTHKVHHPITNKQIDFSKSDITKYKNKLHDALMHQPYVACRMGHLSTVNNEWGFIRTDNKIHSFKKLVRGDVDTKEIDPDNVSLRPRQKGVDMKLGIDITSVVLKKLANKIILISGDSDFVPAAKLARVEGAHFILDAMGRTVKGDLAEHIDGLKSHVSWYKKEDPTGLKEKKVTRCEQDNNLS